MRKANIVVLMSTYNGEKYLDRQIRSIMNQKVKYDFDLLVRDDGSNDLTINCLESWKKCYPNITVLHGMNKGVVGSFLSLLEYAYDIGYEYYFFSDQDDFWLPEKLESAIGMFEKINASEPVMYGNRSKIVDENLKFEGSYTHLKKRELNFFNTAIQNICCGHGQAINNKMAEKILNHTHLSKKIYSQDLWFINVAATCGKIIYDSEPHTLYSMHANNELGFGKGRLDWFKQHFERMKKNEVKKMSVQLKYFSDSYVRYLSDVEKEEVDNFFRSQSTIFKRIRYATKTRFYRQTIVETLMFKLLYIMGKYKI